MLWMSAKTEKVFNVNLMSVGTYKWLTVSVVKSPLATDWV